MESNDTHNQANKLEVPTPKKHIVSLRKSTILCLIVISFLLGITASYALGLSRNNTKNTDDKNSTQLTQLLADTQDDAKTLKQENDQLLKYLENDQNSTAQKPADTTQKNTINSDDIDVTAPIDCSNYKHKQVGVKMDIYEQIKDGFVGNWIGCVTTPWIDPYLVNVTFNKDGTYSAKRIDGNGVAFYYGTDDDTTAKTYSIDNLYSNGESIGTLILYFGENNTNTSELKKIYVYQKTMSFEYWHRGEYGPVKFELVKKQEI